MPKTAVPRQYSGFLKSALDYVNENYATEIITPRRADCKQFLARAADFFNQSDFGGVAALIERSQRNFPPTSFSARGKIRHVDALTTEIKNRARCHHADNVADVIHRALNLSTPLLCSR